MGSTDDWTVRPYKRGEDIVAHDAVWLVLTDDDDNPGAFKLQVGDHGEDVLAGEGVGIVFSPDLASAIVDQFLEESVPYWNNLKAKR